VQKLEAYGGVQTLPALKLAADKHSSLLSVFTDKEKCFLTLTLEVETIKFSLSDNMTLFQYLCGRLTPNRVECHDTQHNDVSITTFSIMTEHCYADCHLLSVTYAECHICCLILTGKYSLLC
jgi:hypothetical protein